MSTNPSNTKKQAIVSQKDLNLLLRIIKTNWWVPIVVLPFFYVIGTFYVYRLTNIYQASTQFLLKVNDTYYQNNVLSDASFYSYGSYVDNLNEQRIIQSYDLSSQVVDKLLDKIQVSYFIVGKVRTTEEFRDMPFEVIINSVNPGFYEQVFDLRIIDYKNYELSYDQDGSKQIIKGKFDEELIDVNLRITINHTYIFNEKKVGSFKEIFYQFSIHSKDYLISNIQSNLTIENQNYQKIYKDISFFKIKYIFKTILNQIKHKFTLKNRTNHNKK